MAIDADRLADQVQEGEIDLDEALRMYLPSAKPDVINVCSQAIFYYQQEDQASILTFPNGVKMSAFDIVEEYGLEAFVL